MSLSGLSKEEFDQTLLSVGSHKTVRPLSPIEVALNCQKAKGAGASVKEISASFGLGGPTMIGRFLKLLMIDKDVQHLIDWGESKISVVGFSPAIEVSQLPVCEHKEVCTAICQHALSKTETRSVRQLYQRARKPIGECIKDVVARRTIVIERQIVLGAITEGSLVERLSSLIQSQRDDLLNESLVHLYPNIDEYVAKLGPRRFTVIGGRAVAKSIAQDRDFESKVAQEIRNRVGNLTGDKPSNE